MNIIRPSITIFFLPNLSLRNPIGTCINAWDKEYIPNAIPAKKADEFSYSDAYKLKIGNKTKRPNNLKENIKLTTNVDLNSFLVNDIEYYEIYHNLLHFCLLWKCIHLC